MIVEKAYAKINLFLNVTARRPDGYHDIESVMHAVNLHDVVSVEARKADRAKITVRTNSDELCSEKNNLAYIAAEKYLSKYSIRDEITVVIEKNIPIGAGLGGGSSDAAATLRAINKIYGRSGTAELLELASSVGSDVPFCLVGGTACCLGRGELITPLSVKEKMYFAIAIGEARISTPRAFSALDELYRDRFPDKGDVCRKMIFSLERGLDISQCVYNAFDCVTDIFEVKKIKEIMINSGAECSLMSGSGPAVFGIFKTKAAAEAAVNNLSADGFLTSFAESVVEPYIDL